MPSDQGKRCNSGNAGGPYGTAFKPSRTPENRCDTRVPESRQTRKVRSAAVREVDAAADPAAAQNTGQLSNPARRPVLRRLRSSQVDTLVARYEAGQSLRGLAAELGIHHRTVAAHLEQRAVPQRVNRPKMTAPVVLPARPSHEADAHSRLSRPPFSVEAQTARRELRRAGVETPPR